MNNLSAVKNVVIAGGGTAGWMAATALAKLIGNKLNITLVESDEISTVGVGEATIPPLVTFHKMLKINEAEFMSSVNATFKLGINFENWKDTSSEYFHSFGTTGRDCWATTFLQFYNRSKQEGYQASYEDYCLELQAGMNQKFAHLPDSGLKYAYHMDSTLYARFLRTISEQHGVTRIEGTIDQVNIDEESGFITSLKLTSGHIIEGDLFIDCTGFRGVLIEQALHTGYEDWSHWLPCDRAVAVQTESIEDPKPYTRCIAHESGWQWRIPLQHRTGNGLVYCSKYLNDEDAEQLLRKNVEGKILKKPLFIKFSPGQRRKHWNKNCVALGLSSGFIEPLESTSIHLIQRGIIRLMQMFPKTGITDSVINEYNFQAKEEVQYIRDFIILHYHLTNRNDSNFWRYCSKMEVPSSLTHRLELFKDHGYVFKAPWDLFAENSWIQVMQGQGLSPQMHHPIADMMSDKEQDMFMNGIKNSISQTVQSLPTHKQYLDQYCKSKG
jgi:tryptophan halogenase